MHLIPPPQPEYWVLSLSGGKDSTALGLEWLKRHQQDPVTYPLHEVIYCDTGMEFPAMVEHINRLEQIFTEAGIKFTRLKSEKSFEYLMFEYQPKRSNPALKNKSGWSWPGPKARWCTKSLKTRVINKYLDTLRSQYNMIQLILIKLAKQDHQKERWGRVWEDPLCRKYKRPEHEDFWIWNYDFYNAPVEDLRYILKLVEG